MIFLKKNPKKESKNKSFDDRNTIVQRHFDKFKK